MQRLIILARFAKMINFYYIPLESSEEDIVLHFVKLRMVTSVSFLKVLER